MSGRPSPSQTACSLESVRPWCARYDGEHPLFKQARRGAVGLQVRRVNHDALGIAGVGLFRAAEVMRSGIGRQMPSPNMLGRSPAERTANPELGSQQP